MKESRTEKATRNVVSGMFQMVINIFINFVGRIVFVQILDASYLGINGLFSNILSILSLADLGMSTAMMYHLYKPIVENDKNKIRDLVGYFRRIYLIIAGIVFCIGIAIIPFLKYIINLEQDIPFVQGYYILALLNVVISYLFVYRTTLVMADQKNYILNKYIIGFKILTFFIQIVILIIFKNYFLYLLVAVILNFVCNLCQNKVALRLYPFLKDTSLKLEEIERKKIFEDVKSLFLYKIAGTIQSNTDNILISIFVGTVSVGYYSNYSMLTAQIISVITLIFNNIKASVGNLIADAKATIDKKLELFNMLELANFWIVAFCSIALVVLSNDFILICFGKEYVLGIEVVIVMVLNFYTSNIRQTLWAYRETTGIFVQTKYITLVTAIINIVLSILFGYIWGIVGILAATVLSRLIYAWWKEPQILFRDVFQKSPKSYYWIYIKRLIFCILVTTVTYIVANKIVFSNIYIMFVYKMLVCCIIPNIIFLLVYYRTDEFKYLFDKIIAKMLPIKNK